MRKWPEAGPSRRPGLFPVYGAVFFLMPFAGGLYFPWQSGLAAAVQAAALLWQIGRSRCLRWPRSPVPWCCGLVLLAGALWNLAKGIDPGAAGDGLLRLAACGLFALLVFQWDADRRKELLALLPLSGAAMVLVTLLAGLHPGLRPFFYENSRMAGPFQYANTFAAFLLVGLAVERPPGRRILYGAASLLLLFGIVASGSRSALLLLAGLLVFRLVRRRPEKGFWLAVLGVAVLSAGCALVGNGWVFARFARPEAFSTLWGRLLYMKDGLHLLAEHPLGVGYLGWFYLQRMVQTGVYNVRFVHNDWLQLALDYGLPAALAAGGWVLYRLRRGACAPPVVLLLGLHCLADPDFAFLWMAFVFLLALSPRTELPCLVLRGRTAATVCVTCAACLFLLRGAADGAFRLGNLPLARALDPWDTELATEEMLTRTSLADAAEDARSILERNPFQAIAWQILAEDAMDRGAYDTMATAQRQAVVVRKYDQTVYDEALNRLQYALSNGWDRTRAAEEMSWLLAHMDAALENTDPLAWRLKDQPELAFPERVRLMIHLMEQAQ